MKLITALSNSSNQSIVLALDNGTKVTMTLRYYSNQQGWYYDLDYPDASFNVVNRRLVTSPNMLRAFRDIIPFGLSVTTSDGYEPIFIGDFVSGRTQIYLLNAADVAAVEAATQHA